MKKELYIGGYDFGLWRVKKSTKLFRIASYKEALAICDDVPCEMMQVIYASRQNGIKTMSIWCDGYAGHMTSLQTIGRAFRMYSKLSIDVPVIKSNTEIFIAQTVTIILLGDRNEAWQKNYI